MGVRPHGRRLLRPQRPHRADARHRLGGRLRGLRVGALRRGPRPRSGGGQRGRQAEAFKKKPGSRGTKLHQHRPPDSKSMLKIIRDVS